MKHLTILILVVVAATGCRSAIAPTQAGPERPRPTAIPPESRCREIAACQTACGQRDASACTRWGEMLAGGLFGHPDSTAAAAAYEEGCARGDARACMLRAQDLYQGSEADV